MNYSVGQEVKVNCKDGSQKLGKVASTYKGGMTVEAYDGEIHTVGKKENYASPIGNLETIKNSSAALKEISKLARASRKLETAAMSTKGKSLIKKALTSIMSGLNDWDKFIETEKTEFKKAKK